MRDRLVELIANCAKQPFMIDGLALWADTIADYLIANNVVVMPRKNDPWIIVKNELVEVANGT